MNSALQNHENPLKPVKRRTESFAKARRETDSPTLGGRTSRVTTHKKPYKPSARKIRLIQALLKNNWRRQAS